MRNVHREAALLLFAGAACLFLFLSGPGDRAAAVPVEGVSYEHLARAIELFEAGRYDEAFEETSRQIEINRFCALAYYYRARIRVIRKQYRLAEVSLRAAFRDSSGFTDAVGLHAYVLKKRGRDAEALAEWKRFLDALGAGEEAAPSPESITLPELFRARLDSIRAVRAAEARPASPDTSAAGAAAGPSFPMPVIEYVEMLKGGEGGGAEAEPGERWGRARRLAVVAAGLAVLAALLVVVRRAGAGKRRVESRAEEPGAGETGKDTEGGEEPVFALSEEEQLARLSGGTPYERALRLKLERRRHRREVERLLEKVQ